MRIIDTQPALNALCEDFSTAPYVTVDTEFMRERTYWPILCLIQIARPGEDDDTAAIIDPMVEGLDLAPLYALMANEAVVKVFHAARQDVEIFHHYGGVIPTPLFDTQLAAMVCGFGDQAGYETLVKRIAGRQLDKSSRFTDWAARPLSGKQLTYALGDVTHLRQIYEDLAERLRKTGREHWLTEELAILTAPGTYDIDPRETWRRVKTRTTNGRFLAIVRELAAWRETEARTRNIPRTRLMKDDALLEVAANRPRTTEDLGKSRLLLREGRKGPAAESILAAVRAGEACPVDQRPFVPEPLQPAPGSGALSDLLKVLLKAKSAETGVAQKLIASSADLDQIASGDAPDVRALKGWRLAAFGEEALRLKRGEIALSATSRGVKIIRL